MKHGKRERRVLPLLADGREYPDMAVTEFKNGLTHLALSVPHLNPVQTS